jgi:hypothetical protein
MKLLERKWQCKKKVVPSPDEEMKKDLMMAACIAVDIERNHSIGPVDDSPLVAT